MISSTIAKMIKNIITLFEAKVVVASLLIVLFYALFVYRQQKCHRKRGGKSESLFYKECVFGLFKFLKIDKFLC